MLAVCAALTATGLVNATSAQAAPAPLPSHNAVLATAYRAQAYYQPTYAVSPSFPPRNGWSWATYQQGQLALSRAAADDGFLQNVLAWGASNQWAITTDVHEVNPDRMKAAQVYTAAGHLSSTADHSKGDAAVASDLTRLPTDQYDYEDALFMGLTNWADAYARTGNVAYLDKMDALFAYTRDAAAASDRCPGSGKTGGLWDEAHGLWFRDCRFIVTEPNGQPQFWGRGNGWVMAAMADALQALPAGSPRADQYAAVLTRMASAIAPLQGSDGMWRTSLLDPASYPAPETSATALITYALAYGVRSGRLPAATYDPVIARAWNALSTYSVTSTGFVRGCQPVGGAPGPVFSGTAPTTPPTATSAGSVGVESPPYCVGAILLAASEVAALDPDLARGAVATGPATSGFPASNLVDGQQGTRWQAATFPKAATLDLRAAVPVSQVQVGTFADRAYRYRVETSSDGATWTTRVDRTQNTTKGTLLDSFAPVTARFVRLTVTGISGTTTSSAAITGLGVFGAPSAPSGQPNLTVPALTNGTSVARGGTLTVTATVRNAGTAAVPTTSALRYYLSTNQTYDASDTYLGARTIPALAAGAQQALGLNAVVPTSVPKGSYWIIARADASGVVAESSETDNGRTSTTTVTVS